MMDVCEVVTWYSVAMVPRNAVAAMAVRRAMRGMAKCLCSKNGGGPGDPHGDDDGLS
jgi:hypothetical protein